MQKKTGVVPFIFDSAQDRSNRHPVKPCSHLSATFFISPCSLSDVCEATLEATLPSLVHSRCHEKSRVTVATMSPTQP